MINNEIRTARVVKAGHSLSEAQVNASQMTIDWIMDERARELCGEWLRWFDLKRILGPQGKFAANWLNWRVQLRNAIPTAVKGLGRLKLGNYAAKWSCPWPQIVRVCIKYTLFMPCSKPGGASEPGWRSLTMTETWRPPSPSARI